MSKPFRYLLLIGAAAAVAAALWLVWPRPRLLMRRATRVNVPGGKLSGGAYHWLGLDTLLVARPDGLAQRLDLRTGQRRLLPSLSRFIAPVAPHLFDPADYVKILVPSPDGRWVLRSPWWHGLHPLWAEEVEGTRSVRPAFDRASEWTPVWLPDSRGWIASAPPLHGRPAQCAVFSLDPSVPVRTAPFYPGDEEHSWQVVAAPSPHSATIWGSTRGDGASKGDLLVTLDLRAGQRPATSTTRFPLDARIHLHAWSPTSRRVAWLCAAEPKQPKGAVARWCWRLLGRRARPEWQLWTSRANGTDMRLVGTREQGDSEGDDITGLEWTPDGKRISFIYGEALYTVPAD